jgi:DNA-binding transcriptional ArsR family regulator
MSRQNNPLQLPAEDCAVRRVDLEKVRKGRALLLSDSVYADTAATFRVLSDQSRAKIVFSLLQQELCVCDLAAVCDLSESATSQHLRILRALRVVKVRRSGRMAYYRIDDEHTRVLLRVCLNQVGDRDALEGLA